MGALPGRVPIASVTAPVSIAGIRPRARPPAERRRRFLVAVANHSVAIAFATVFVLPFIFILLTAMMSRTQALAGSLWPHPLKLDNFVRVFRYVPLWQYTWNTVVYAVLSTFGTVASSIPVAYALSRMRWRGRQAAFVLVLSTLMLPPQVTLIPTYILFSRLGWLNTLLPLVVPTFFATSGFAIFLLRQFFLTVPRDVDEAALIDGAGFFTIYWRIVLPLARPALGVVVVLTFAHSWNAFTQPLIVPAFFGDAFTIFLLRQFFMTIPEELSEAARVDGASELQILTRVIMPLAKPAIAAVALFQFLYCWNDFFGPLLYTGSNPHIWTLAVGLSQFSSVLHQGVLWNIQMAASILFMLPVIALFFVAQRAFIEGVTLTGVKG